MEGQEKDQEFEATGNVSADSDSLQIDQAAQQKNERRQGSGPSQSWSYSTAEEGPIMDGNRSSNGIDPTSKGPDSRENFSLNQLHARINHLEGLLADKEAALIAVTQELDAVKEMSCIDASIGPLASGFDVDFKASITEYNRKLHEHASALCQRDEIIEKLASSLKQSVQDREELKNEAGRLTEQVHTLQLQLHNFGQHVQQPQTKLLEALKEKDVQLQQKSAQLSQSKAQSSKEVQFLMSSLEELQQRAARSASASPPLTTATIKDQLTRKQSAELNELRLQYDSDKKQLTEQVAEARHSESLMRSQLATVQKECEKLILEISSLKLAHETQLSTCRDQHEEELNQNLEEKVRRVTELENDVLSLRLQLQDKSLECKKQEERIQLLQNEAHKYSTDIATCHQTLEQYKKRVDDLQMKCSQDLAQKDASHQVEVTLLNSRISELEEAHSLQLHSINLDLNRMKQRQMEELGMMQLSHENEVNTSKRDAERYRTELREKNNLLAVQEQQLDEEKQWSRTYSQQVQELGEKLNEEEYKNEEYRGKIESLEQQLQEIDQACTLYQPQIEFLHQQLKDERQKSTNIMQQLDDVRKQLLLEQERCKAYSLSMETANSNIRDLQRKNAEIKLQSSKLDQSAKQKLINEHQKNAALQGEIVTLSEQLKQERNLTVTYKNQIEALNYQVKSCSTLENALQDVQKLLDKEKLVVASYKCEIETLNQNLKDEKIKYVNDGHKLHLQLQENQASKRDYENRLEELKKQLLAMQQQQTHLEQQIKSGEMCKCQKNSGTCIETKCLTDEDNQQPSQAQSLCEKYVEQVKSLELKLMVLSETNMQLKKERERAEIELCEVKELYATSKEEFDRSCHDLKKEISMKEEDIVKLQKQSDEVSLQRKEINAYNKQINELISAKAILGNELVSLKEEHCKEIMVLKDQVVQTENQMKTCCKTFPEETMELLVKKCHDDIQCLRSMYASNISGDINSVENMRQLSSSATHLPGLWSLEKLLDLCNDYSKEDPGGMSSSKNIVAEISKSLMTVEKLKLELENKNEQNEALKLECDKLISQNENLVKQINHLESDVKSLGNGCNKPCLPFITSASESEESRFQQLPSGISDLLSCWVRQCQDLDKSNMQLKSDVFDLQAKLTEAERKISLSNRITKKTSVDASKSCSCYKNFSEERDLLKKFIDTLQKEMTAKELDCEEKIKSILKKSKRSNQFNLNCNDNLTNLINDFSCKAKEIILLQDDLKSSQRECQIYSCENRRQAEELKKIYTALEESWQMCQSLESDLHNALKENGIFRARLMRLETFYESVNQRGVVPNKLLYKLIEQVSVADDDSGSAASCKNKENTSKSSMFENFEAVMKIINRLNADCKSSLVKVQKDDKKAKARVCDNLQSESLGLETETEQTIMSETGPAPQLHVDLLKQVIYQDICEAHYSLEAEMREMEERFQQQEEHLQEQLHKHKASAKFWQLKALSADMQLSTLQVMEHSHEGNVHNIVTEMDLMYSEALNTLHDEVERVASLRERKVREEMAEKLAAVQKNHKQQLDLLDKHIKADNNVRALHLLHQQEIDAVRAECDYVHIKDLVKLQEQLSSSLKHPRLINLSCSCNKLSVSVMKHDISLLYSMGLRKICTTFQSVLANELEHFEAKFGNVCSHQDSEFDFAIPDIKDETCLDTLEQLVFKCKELGEKLVEMQSTGLQSILSVCEEQHVVVMEKLKRMVTEFDTLCDVKSMQEELSRAKEEHRLALESISASHKVQVSRLSVLSQQNVNETSETNETALSVLRRDLEEKHKSQMEELRTYFEQKCADFEKHYSEEVFSQHSRKLSDCSSASESELVSEMYYAGPAATAAGPGAQSQPHFCHLLAETSFKELEDHSQSVDLNKLFVENREQIEAMRLALESRHQGELEAQKELYEARVEELLRNMNESHAAELKLQCNRLQEMQEVENALNKKLTEAQKEIALLKEELLSFRTREPSAECISGGDHEEHQSSSPNSELEAELQRMADILKLKDSESSAQIATLKVKLRENHEVMSKLEKEMSNLRSKYDLDTGSLTLRINEKIEQIKELKLKAEELTKSLKESDGLQKHFQLESNNTCIKLKEEFETLLKQKDKEYDCKINEMRLELEEKYTLHENMNKSVEEKKKLLEAEYSEYLEFVKKCADDTKVELMQQHEKELKEMIDKHEKEILELKNSPRNSHSKRDQNKENKPGLQSTLTNECLIKESSLSNCLQELLRLSGDLDVKHQEHLEKIIMKLCEEEALHQDKLHEDLELRLESVQKDCERRFHLQLEEARADIVQALEKQIQQLLDDKTDTLDKPVELQQLEEKFTSKYQQKLTSMQKEHDAKVSDLLVKHAAQMSAAREKKQNMNDVSFTAEELDKLYKERDCLRNVAATLRDVVAELVRYFMSWEDDFNNTLLDELVKLEAEKNSDILSITHEEDSIIFKQPQSVSQILQDSTTSEEEMPVIVATPARGRRCVKRVHFAHNVSGILSLLDDGSLLEGVGDASLNFQEELDRCLARLRCDAAALYALAKPALPTVSARKQCSPTYCKEKLLESESKALQLQKENDELQNQLDVLQEEQEKYLAELQATRLRLNSLELKVAQAEVVAEGYGEGEPSISCEVLSSPHATNVEELQKKARLLLLGSCTPDTGNNGSAREVISGVVSPNTSQHLPHLVEELCRTWERLADESRQKQEDLHQQVEAADKQLRAARTFMEEQANEREQERDEFVNEMKRLQELLRDKDRDRSSHLQMNHEVEALENQIKETQSALDNTQQQLKKLNAEHKQAVEKIWTLRDIISDLEVQVASKAEEAAAVSAQNKALHQMVEQQGRTQLELAQEMEELQMCPNNGKLAEQIIQLEEQLRKHQMLADQFGDPTAIDQMKVQLHDLATSLELHTRELECANANACSTLPASPCLSSPSEDVSIRETLEAMRATAENKEASQSTLPFNEVSLIMEQWQKHARADDAVLKKICDLDMQLDDVQAEKGALVTRLQEQMQLSSSLQAKLDEHRRKADVKHVQATTAMQSQIEDLRSEIQNYVETLEAREKQIENLKSSLRQVENELRIRDVEVRRSAETERSIAAQLQLQFSKLSADKEKLQASLSKKDAMHVSLPALIESMLFDKNADIDRLEKQVQHLTRQAELSSRYVATPSTTLEFEYCEPEKVRAHVELSPVFELRRSVELPTINESVCEKSDIRPNDATVSLMAQQIFLDNNGPELVPETEVSLKPVPLEETMAQQNSSYDSTSEILNSSIDTLNSLSLSSCKIKVATLKDELDIKNKTLADYLQQINEKTAIISKMEQRCKYLEDCEKKLSDMSKSEKELKTAVDIDKEHLQKMSQDKEIDFKKLGDKLSTTETEITKDKVSDQPNEFHQPTEKFSELEDKESEIQRLKDEVGATQAILANLQRKVQEAKQIARSPSRPSPENNQALRIVENELEAAKQEIVELKDLCKSIKSEFAKQNQAQLEMVLHREQQAKNSLVETLKDIEEEKKTKFVNMEEELKIARNKLEEKDKEKQKLQSELNQLNLECVTLKKQLMTPISQATTLASKLDAEKKFADALKEELLLFKNKASFLDEECHSLREKVKNLEAALYSANKTDQIDKEYKKLSKEVLELIDSKDSLLEELSKRKRSVDKLAHENAVLREENSEVGKELSDMKQIIIQMHGLKASRDEAERNLHAKMNELNEIESNKNMLLKQLTSLRQALKNIDGTMDNLPGLAEEDFCILREMQKHLSPSNYRGGGDGPWNKLSVTETDVYEIRPIESPLTELESLDDLTGLVQHELDVSVQLDHSLLQTIDPCGNKKSNTASVLAVGQTRKNVVQIGAQEAELNGHGGNEAAGQNQTVRMELSEAQDKIYQLETELSQMKVSLQLVHSQLETERVQYYKLQQQDCDLIEEMRVKLSSALDGQASLHMQLQSEIGRHRTLVADMKEPVAPPKTSFSPLPADKSRDILQAELNKTKSELSKLLMEKDATEKQLRRLQEAEIQRSRRRAVIEEKHRRRIDQLQTLQAETQQECAMLRQELLTVNQKLLLTQEELAKGQDAQLKNHTPFVERLRNMNAFLEEHIEENMRMAKQMGDLTEEHKKLRLRIAQLEGQLQLADKRNNDSYEAANARFAAQQCEWEAQHKMLLLALNDAKQKQVLSPDSDVEERVTHLFGRYLRMQSYRKALMWQKRYLLSVITGLNESKNLAASHLTSLGEIPKEKQSNPRRKFRSAVMVMMAIHRMQFMVQRWLRGKRIGCGVVVQQTLSHYTFATDHQTIFPSSHKTLHSEEMRSGLSQSPPTLERPRQFHSDPSASSQFPRLSMNNKGLGPTNTLSECVSNFHLVKQRFDALLSNPPR